MSKPKKQHYVPASYLREFIDANKPEIYEPFVWIFSKDGNSRESRAPHNIFSETDLYTLEIAGEKRYLIETSLSQLEGRYVEVVRNKVNRHLPLTDEEHVILCAFIAAMMLRTLRMKENIEFFLEELAQKVEMMEAMHGSSNETSRELRTLKKDTHRESLILLLPKITQMLLGLSVAFLCTCVQHTRFITSDDPVTLFNPDLQWQTLFGPGLAQRNIQVTMPISPSITVCLTRADVHGYVRLPGRYVEDLNRLTRARSFKYFVASSKRKKWAWFSPVPVFRPLFAIKVALHIMKTKVKKITSHSR